VREAAQVLPNVYLKALLLGSFVGLVAFAVPLTATGGSPQLVYEIENASTLGLGLLLLVLLAKMVAVSLSQEAGFLGGIVFPILFIGGTAGLIVNSVIPQVPAGLAVACMLAAVPGAIIAAPVSFVLIGVGTVGLGVAAIAPIGIAVITAYITVSALRLRLSRES